MTSNLLLKISNPYNTGFDVFITLIGTNDSGNQSFGKIKNGQVNWVAADPCFNESSFVYKLSEINLPLEVAPINSGRIYFSVKYPLNWRLGSINGKCVIIEPDACNTKDTNFYYLYDKIEFTYDGTKAWFNPTAVDFFCLPLHIEIIQDKQVIKSSGFTISRCDIFTKLRADIELYQNNPMWDNLWLVFDAFHIKSRYDLRLISPAKWIAAFKAFGGFAGLHNTDTDGIFRRVFSINQDVNFDSFINYLWTYYANCNRFLNIDCSVLANDDKFSPKLTDYIFKGTIIDGKFVFTNKYNELTVTIDKIDSFSLISGAQGSFNFPNHSVGAIIAQTISAAFSVGALPAPDNAILNKEYFLRLKANGQYYRDSSLPFDTHDLYSEILHSIEPVNEFYSFPYDDLLSQDGTLIINQITSNTLVDITIGEIKLNEIPDPYTDNTTYTATINIGKNNNGNYYNIKYQGVTVTPDEPLKIGKVKSPVIVELEGKEVTIFLNPQIVLPCDNAIAANIVVNVQYATDSSNQPIPNQAYANINFPAPPLSLWGKIKKTVLNLF